MAHFIARLPISPAAGPVEIGYAPAGKDEPGNMMPKCRSIT
jgi:hypothetical protein